jgi:hypothetical protein
MQRGLPTVRRKRGCALTYVLNRRDSSSIIWAARAADKNSVFRPQFAYRSNFFSPHLNANQLPLARMTKHARVINLWPRRSHTLGWNYVCCIYNLTLARSLKEAGWPTNKIKTKRFSIAARC